MEKAIEILEKFVEYHEAKEANRRDGGNHFDVWMRWHTISKEFDEMIAEARELIASASQNSSTSESALPISDVGESCKHDFQPYNETHSYCTKCPEMRIDD